MKRGASHVLECNAGKISRRASARNADAGLAGIGFEPSNQLLQIVHRQAVLDADEQRLVGQFGDRRQIVQQIEIEFVKTADQNMRRQGADAQRVTVGRGADHAGDADTSCGARHILNDHGLAERLAHRIG